MRKVTHLAMGLTVAAIAALLVDVGPAEARPGGGRGRGGPSASRGSHARPTQTAGNRGAAQAHQAQGGRAAQAAQSGAGPRAHGANPGPPRAGNDPQSLGQQQAAQQLRQQSAQRRQNRPGQANWQDRPAAANWQNGGQHPRNAQAWWNNYQNGPQPFSPAWYAQHPNAWHATHPYAGRWPVASVAVVGTWLGWAAVPQETYSSTTIYFDGEPVYTDESEAVAGQYDVDASPADVELPAGDWLPLGVYSLVTAPDQDPMQLVQLAVDRNGVVRGVYYDAVTNTSHNVVGSIDRDTQNAQWTLESNPDLAFQTGIDQLTQPTGVVEVTLPSGVQEWQLVRLANTPE